MVVEIFFRRNRAQPIIIYLIVISLFFPFHPYCLAMSFSVEFKLFKNVSWKKNIFRKSCATNYFFYFFLSTVYTYNTYSHEFPCCVKLHKKISWSKKRRQSSCTTISCHQHLSHFTLGQVLFLICIVSKLSNDHVKLELFVSIAVVA